MLPTFIASIIGGPEENSTHFTSMPCGAKCFSSAACWRVTTSTPFF
jgi:hypothetical protein